MLQFCALMRKRNAISEVWSSFQEHAAIKPSRVQKSWWNSMVLQVFWVKIFKIIFNEVLCCCWLFVKLKFPDTASVSLKTGEIITTNRYKSFAHRPLSKKKCNWIWSYTDSPSNIINECILIFMRSFINYSVWFFTPVFEAETKFFFSRTLVEVDNE